MYDYLYRGSRKLGRTKVATFVISARTPKPEVLLDFGFVATDLSGVYRSTQKLLMPITLLVLNKLSREPHNALFKIFASEYKEREASFALLDEIGATQWSPELSETLTALRTILQKQQGDKMKDIVISPEYVKQMGRELRESILKSLTPADYLGQMSPEVRESLIAALTPDQLLERLEPDVVLSNYDPEQRLEGLEPDVVLSHYGPEQLLAQLDVAEIEEYLRKRQQEATQPKAQTPSSSQRKQKPKTARKP